MCNSVVDADWPVTWSKVHHKKTVNSNLLYHIPTEARLVSPPLWLVHYDETQLSHVLLVSEGWLPAEELPYRHMHWWWCLNLKIISHTEATLSFRGPT